MKVRYKGKIGRGLLKLDVDCLNWTWIVEIGRGLLKFLMTYSCVPLLMEFHGIADETAIITLAGRVAEILPALLILAAVMSRFSAAVADTVGAGGLFTELSGSRLSSRLGYIGLVILPR